MTIKQVIVVRNDLDMGKGKIAAQVGHACVLGAEHVENPILSGFLNGGVDKKRLYSKFQA